MLCTKHLMLWMKFLLGICPEVSHFLSRAGLIPGSIWFLRRHLLLLKLLFMWR